MNKTCHELLKAISVLTELKYSGFTYKNSTQKTSKRMISTKVFLFDIIMFCETF